MNIAMILMLSFRNNTTVGLGFHVFLRRLDKMGVVRELNSFLLTGSITN